MITKKRVELAVPQVNINGTSKRELQDQCLQAYRALQDALEALNQMTPHGRDYQTVGFERYDLARSQHQDRMRSVGEIKDEIYAIWESMEGN